MKFTLVIDPAQEEALTATVHRESPFTARLAQLILEENHSGTVPAYTEAGVKLLPFSEIECIALLGGKTCAIDRQGNTYQLHFRLYELEALLPGSFIRINKSALANIDRLERLCASFSGAVDAVFKCGYRDYVSRRCLADIKRRFGIK